MPRVRERVRHARGVLCASAHYGAAAPFMMLLLLMSFCHYFARLHDATPLLPLRRLRYFYAADAAAAADACRLFQHC